MDKSLRLTFWATLWHVHIRNENVIESPGGATTWLRRNIGSCCTPEFIVHHNNLALIRIFLFIQSYSQTECLTRAQIQYCNATQLSKNLLLGLYNRGCKALVASFHLWWFGWNASWVIWAMVGKRKRESERRRVSSATYCHQSSRMFVILCYISYSSLHIARYMCAKQLSGSSILAAVSADASLRVSRCRRVKLCCFLCALPSSETHILSLATEMSCDKFTDCLLIAAVHVEWATSNTRCDQTAMSSKQSNTDLCWQWTGISLVTPICFVSTGIVSRCQSTDSWCRLSPS